MTPPNAIVIAREVESALASTTGRDPVALVETYAPRLTLALELAATPDEANAVRAQAEALHKFVRRVLPKVQSDRQARREAAFPAAWAFVAASRKAGALWNAVDPKDKHTRETGRPVISVENSTLMTVGQAGFIDRKDAQICSRIATLDEQDVDLYRQECQRNGEVPTLHGLYKVWRQVRPPEDTPELPPGQYQVIYADPPWQYDNTEVHGAADDHYKTLPLGDICNIRVKDIAADDAALFLWVTNPFLRDAFSVVDAWGFEYKTNMVWVKSNLVKPGGGFYVRGRHELLFICTRGNFTPLDKHISPPIGSVLEAPLSTHSRKPEAVYDVIEKLYPKCSYLELFAREAREGWDAWGAETGPIRNSD